MYVSSWSSEVEKHSGIASPRPTFALSNQRLVDAPIHNYGKAVGGILYRGAQPAPDDLPWLKSQGIKTMVVLREDREELCYHEADYLANVEACGLRAIVIPMKDGAIPNRLQLEQFIRLVDDPAQQAVYVHCAAGVGRTGVMVGLYLKWHGVAVADILGTSRSFGLVAERRRDLSLQSTFIATYPLSLLKLVRK